MTAAHELRTVRLQLRSLEPRDIGAIARFAGAREIAATTVNIPHPYKEEDALNFLARAENDFRSGDSITFAVTIPPDPQLCGTVGLALTHLHQRADLGYWIGIPFRRKGYATESAAAVVAFAFYKLRLHRIHASHFGGNTASQRVLEKIGLRHEGGSRQHIRKWDRFIDLENYGALAEEFRGGK